MQATSDIARDWQEADEMVRGTNLIDDKDAW